MDEEFDRAWRALSKAVLAEVKLWRVAHPKATFQPAVDTILQRIQQQARSRNVSSRSCRSGNGFLLSGRGGE